MSAKRIEKVSFIGAGNVACSLAPAMKARGIRITEICNRGEGAGKALARRTGAVYVADPADMGNRADLVIISVSDPAIEEVAGTFHTTALVVHTSGPVDIGVLAAASSRTGVLYPLQTFRKGHRTPIGKIPFCIEANSPADTRLLEDFAAGLSGMTERLDSEQRRIIHLAAVFAANFPNYLYSAAEMLLAEKDVPFRLLRPIIRQTAGNADKRDIFSLQTGPAVRNDRRVMETHRKLLHDHPDLLRIYDLLSKSIIQYKQKHG